VGNGDWGQRGVGVHRERYDEVVFDVVRWLASPGWPCSARLLMLTVAGAPNDVGRVASCGAWLRRAVAALAELLVQGPLRRGNGLGDVTKWTLLDATLHTTTARPIRSALLLLGGLGAVLGAPVA